MSTETNITAFYRIWDGVWHQPEETAAVIDNSFADDFAYRISSLEEPVNKVTFKQFVPGWQKAFPDGRMEILDITAGEDKVWCYWKSTGTHSEEYLGIPATGKQVDYKGVDIWRFTADGRVAECWVVPDVLSLLRQLGAIPQ